MSYIISFIKEYIMNTIDVITDSDIRILKESDEYAFRQFDEHLLIKNSKRTCTFSLAQIIFGIVFLIISFVTFDTEAKGTVLKVIGSVILISSGVFLFLYYKSELNLHRPDMSRLKVVFYLFWNLFTIGGFCISAAFYQAEKTACIFIIFFVAVLAVPALRTFENLIAVAIYLIPCIYYGINEKAGAAFYISILFGALAFIWINALKTEYIFRNWSNGRKIKEISDRCSKLSQTDNLTGMLNGAGLSAMLRERYRNKNVGKIAVIVADIDNFRFYNHKNGYDKSDTCLSNICNCIRIISKPVTNLVSRLGGDDFILVLEDMDEIEVVTFAEQLRDSVERMALPFGDKGVVTISIGISGISEIKDGNTYSNLLNEADIQLMIAKKSGKNCIGYRNRAFIQQNGRNKK